MIKGKWFTCIISAGLLLSLVVPVTLAQLGGGPPWPEREQRPESKEMNSKDDSKKEDLREMLETMRIWKMTKVVELTEEQSLKIFPKIHASDKVKEGLGKKKAEILVGLEKLLKEEKPEQAKISEMLNAIEKTESEIRAQEDKLREELKTILSLTQQAKFYIFMKNFEEDVKRMIAEVRGLRKETPLKKNAEKQFPAK